MGLGWVTSEGTEGKEIRWGGVSEVEEQRTGEKMM